MKTRSEDRWFEENREFLRRLCYRMLGSTSDSEDAVQESYLRWLRSGSPELEVPKSWFTKVCTRICMDRLRSKHFRRIEYPGQWLPEPFVEQEKTIEKAETISMALMSAISKLSPMQRAAFLLRDVFGESYERIGETLEISEAACRQHASRARKTLKDGPERFPVQSEAAEQLTQSFFRAVETGDLEGMKSMLAEDVVLKADGGGKLAAVPDPLVGQGRVFRFLVAVFKMQSRLPRPKAEVEFLWLNRGPAVMITTGKERSVFQFQFEGQKIAGIYIQRNPDKMTHLIGK